MPNKKVAIIGTVGIPAKYGGFETLVENLTKYLHGEYDFTVYCSAKSYGDKVKYYNGARLKYINLDANGFQSILYDVFSIVRALSYADTLLILGVSGCTILPIISLISRKRIIVNIDGLEWKREKWNKYAKWFLKLSEKQAVKYAEVIIADNRVIQDYIHDEYGKPSELIAYGADHALKKTTSAATFTQYPFLVQQYACTVCRIEPENKVHLILQAFVKLKTHNLVIIGNWQKSKYGKKLKEQYGYADNLFLLDAIHDQYILDQIRSNCHIYIHVNSAGGTNPSLVEAMYLGLSIFAYDVPYNIETTSHKAKYFNNSEELTLLIENLDQWDLDKISMDMKAIADRYYRWDKISMNYSDIF